MPPRQSVVLVDTMAIKMAHDLHCWNAIRNRFQLHSVAKCVEEATRRSKSGEILVNRDAVQLSAELTLGNVDRLKMADLLLIIGNNADLHEGELHLLTYAREIPGAWFLCGPDNATVRAMKMLSLLDRMTSLESLGKSSGHRFKDKTLPHHFTDRWLLDRRMQVFLEA